MANEDPIKVRQGKNVLDEALSSWKSTRATTPGLSEAVRGEIVRAALASRPEPAPYRPLLGIIPRRILAGALPAAAAGAVLLLFADRLGNDPTHRPLTVRAARSGDEVVFTIANGGRAHRVVKSSVATHFDPSTAVTVRDGSFRDAAHDGSDLVFYRID